MALFLVLAVFLSLSSLGFGVYRAFYHPLSKFPGPILWAISQLPQTYYLFRGSLPFKILELHNRYGPVVRLAPNELSFITTDAWIDIYAKPTKRPQLQKEHTFLPPSTGVSGIIFETDDAEHSRLRRVFSHAFCDKSLRDQEVTVIKYVDQLMVKLQEHTMEPTDMCKWFNLVCFDIIGDLMFSDSFESLHNPYLRPWIQILYDWVAGAALLGMAQKLWPLSIIVKFFVPKDMRDAEVSHRMMTQERLEKRLGSPNASYIDLISNIEPFLSNGKLSSAELLESCRVMLVGGAETMATVASGMLYHLVNNPTALSTLKAEIRSEFNATGEINVNASQKLTYLSAVIKESLRMFPPLPGNLRRITSPEGCVIGGKFVPGDISVGVHIYASNLSGQNFNRPMEFRPERWLSKVAEEFQADDRQATQPFSIGPRNCIAKNFALMEMQLILAKLVFQFDLELAEESKFWMNEVKVFGFVQKPKLMVKLAAV